jgi:RNA polymerase primary sigma factor
MRQLKINKSITNRETASLDKYLQEIVKEAMISVEEETRLAQLIKQGDEAALVKLTKANLSFVVSVAKQYQNKGLSLPDLINEGNLGLKKKKKRFDETRGFKFISYAVWWIRQAIIQAIGEQSRIVRLPLNQIGALSRISKEFARLEQKLERPPLPDELADSLAMPYEKMSFVMKISSRHVSMDAPLTHDDDTKFIDIYAGDDLLAADASMIEESLSTEISRALATLTPKERDVIILYFGLGMDHGCTLEEIAVRFDLTRERVRQIKEKAIRRLKHNSRNNLLKAYLCQ